MKAPISARSYTENHGHGSIIISLCIVTILCCVPFHAVVAAQTLSPGASFPVSGKKWTLAFYFAGENSLENDHVKNLKELCRGVSSVKDASVVAFMDRDDDIRLENAFTAWKGSRAFIIDRGFKEVVKNPVVVPVPQSIKHSRFKNILASLTEESSRKLLAESYLEKDGRYVLKKRDASRKEHIRHILTDQAGYLLPLNGKEYANLNATRAATLAAFLSFVKDNFISEHYALFIAGHGNGWFIEDRPAEKHGSEYPDEYFKDIEVPMIQDALMHEPVDVLVLDICFMGDIETAWALKDTSRYLVFSQTSLPSMGLDYADLLNGLAGNAVLTPKDVAFETIESYRRTYEKRNYPVSVSALELGEDFRSFVHSLQAAASDHERLPALKTAAKETPHTPSRSSNRNKMADLVSMVMNVEKTQQPSFISGISFMLSHFSVNTHAKGISIYLPLTRELYQQDSEQYARTDFARDFPEGWVKVLPQLID